MTLYEIDNAYQSLCAAYEAAETEEEKQTILDTLDSFFRSLGSGGNGN